MADIKYNLDNIISKAIHRPIIKSSIELPPLYARVGNESETEYMSEGTKNEIWIRSVQRNYNSPTNVRRLFIGESFVTIQYYQPPIIDGKSSGKYWYTYKLEIDEPLNILAFKSKIHNKLVMSAAMNGQQAPQRVVLTGTGLAAVSAHWKMSNVEEIFITPSILASESIENQFPLAQNMLQYFISTENGSNTVGRSLKDAGKLALSIFEYVNGNNIKNIRTRFPRLRTIGFMTNLDKIMELPGSKNLREGLPSTVAELGTRWINEIKSNNLSKMCSLGLTEVPFDNQNHTEFNIRAGIYRFDDEVLSSYIDKYKAKVLELGRAKRDESLSLTKKEVKTEKSSYERTLDALRSERGDNAVSAILQLTFARSTQKEIDEAFNNMSSDGKVLYRKLLGR